MSYKHNNLLAMRESWWNDETSAMVQLEKSFLQRTLIDQAIYPIATLEDVRYFFFTLPSIIIVKGYALGFSHPLVKEMILQHIETNHQMLMHRADVKIQFRMT